MKVLFVLLLVAVLVAADTDIWSAWSTCRTQHDRSMQLCTNDAQCSNGCDYLTGTCFPASTSAASSALSCVSAAYPSPLWEVPFSHQPTLSLTTGAGNVVLSFADDVAMPLPPPIGSDTPSSAACHWDPRNAQRQTTETCRPDPRHQDPAGFCGRRWAASGRCTPLSLPGKCWSHTGGSSAACTGNGGHPVDKNARCEWDNMFDATTCLAKECGPRFHRKDLWGKIICAMYCYDRKYYNEVECHLHTSEWKSNPKLYGWDAVSKRCRVDCTNCRADFNKEGSSPNAVRLGTCARSTEREWHPPKYPTPEACATADASHATLETYDSLVPSSKWEACSVLGHSDCPTVPLNATVVVSGCVFPSGETARGAPFIVLPRNLGEWLPDASLEQCSALTGGSWTTWVPAGEDTDVTVQVTPVQQGRVQWCKRDAVANFTLPSSYATERAKWIGITSLALVVTKTVAQDESLGNWHSSTWTIASGSWTPSGSPFGVYWQGNSTNPKLLRMAIVPDGDSSTYTVNITVGLEKSVPEDMSLPLLCGPADGPQPNGSYTHATYGQCLEMTDFVMFNVDWTSPPAKREETTPSPTPSPTTPDVHMSALSPERTSHGLSPSGDCFVHGFLPPDCTTRLCGRYNPLDKEIRGVAEGPSGQCTCARGWGGPECNHCAIPKVSIDHRNYHYMCVQLAFLKADGSGIEKSVQWSKVPVPVEDTQMWVDGLLGFNGFKNLHNRPAGTAGFDCMCRYPRPEFDVAHGSAREAELYHSQRAEYRDLPLNSTEITTVAACLLSAGVDTDTSDDILALAAGTLPSGLNCDGRIGGIWRLILIVGCVLVALTFLFTLMRECGKDADRNYQSEIESLEESLDDEEFEASDSTLIGSKQTQRRARKRTHSLRSR